MSNHLAIATVTAALGQLVHGAAESAVPGVALRFGRPTAVAGPADRKVHIYLYQVVPSAALRNADLPTRNASGALTARPQVALDLHYLLTFYGNDQDLEPDRMLGAVVRNLHARPVLSSAAIRNAILSHDPELAGSNLAFSIERVKFTPAPLSLEEMSKLWSVFVQTPHALSVAYQGTVVLIEAEEGPLAALPVLRRGEEDQGVDTRIGPFPRLDAVRVGPPAALGRRPPLPSYPTAELGLSLELSGASLGGDQVTLRFAHPRVPPRELQVPAADRSPETLTVVLPQDAASQTEWAAGIYGVTALIRRGDSEHSSNAIPLPLSPHIADIQPNPAARDATGDVTLTVTCGPRVLQGQPAVLLLADREVPAEPLGAAGDTLTFVIRNAPLVQDSLVQVRVDGVTSLPFRFDEPTRRLVFDDSQRVTIQ